MAKASIGVRDIARMTGVSISTVSRVINNAPNTSESARRKVQAIIDEYNYVPNISAKNLFSNESKSIAIFLLDIFNPFFAAVVKELNTLAMTNGYALLICNTENDPERELQYLKYCVGIRTKGIIFTEGYSKNILQYKQNGVNYVFHDRYVSDEFYSVKSNNEKGIHILTDYLYNLNHRKFAFVGYSSKTKTSQERKDAFVSSLAAKGIEVDPKYIFEEEMKMQTGVDALDYFCSLPERPTAVVCANDEIAKGFIIRANNINMKIPDDFSVVGFDGVESSIFFPKLTTIRQDVKLISQKLFQHATSNDFQPEQFIADVSFVMGDTCKNIVR